MSASTPGNEWLKRTEYRMDPETSSEWHCLSFIVPITIFRQNKPVWALLLRVGTTQSWGSNRSPIFDWDCGPFAIVCFETFLLNRLCEFLFWLDLFGTFWGNAKKYERNYHTDACQNLFLVLWIFKGSNGFWNKFRMTKNSHAERCQHPFRVMND